MELRPILLLLAFMATAYAACSDQTLKLGNINCTVKSKQMKIRCEKLDFDIGSVKELDTDGSVVGNTGNDKHSSENAKSDDFCAENPIDDTTIPYSNVKAKAMKAYGTLSGLSSKITVWVYIAKEDGNITIGDECFGIRKGQVKFTFELSNWTWCCEDASADNCEECTKGGVKQVGDKVEVEFVVKTPGDQAPTEAPTNFSASCNVDSEEPPAFYQLDSGVDVLLSMKVKVDNADPTSASPKPTVEQKGAKNYLKFTCPKFNDKCIYDPTSTVTDQAYDEDPDDKPDDKDSASTMTSLCLSILALRYLF